MKRPYRLALPWSLAALSACSPGVAAQAAADLAAPAPAPGTAWLADAAGYEIFVRSFADSNGDGSGDLAGITARLPVLQQLGVDLLWLTPIHPSPSYHGYDVTDYLAVHPDFGALADLDQLVAQAHHRGIRVLLDLVANHTSNQHQWFRAAQQGGAAAGRYLVRGDDPGWIISGRHAFKPLPGADGGAGRYYFSIFSAPLPDLNYRDRQTLPAMQDVVAFWLGRGVDGYRLDAARYLVEDPDPVGATALPAYADTAQTHGVWKTLRGTLERAAPQAVFLGEVWADLPTIAGYVGDRDELHGCFGFPTAGAILDSVNQGSPQPLAAALRAQLGAALPAGFLAPFLSNHDQRRAASVLGGQPEALALAAAILLALPGPPFLYYGEEIGMQQDPTVSGDMGQRAQMQWDEVARQQADPGSLWRRYQQLLSLRRGQPGLRAAALQVLPASDPGLLVLARGTGAQQVIAVYNLGRAAVSGASVALPGDGLGGPVRDLLAGGAAAAVTSGNRAKYPLPAIPARGALWLAGT